MGRNVGSSLLRHGDVMSLHIAGPTEPQNLEKQVRKKSNEMQYSEYMAKHELTVIPGTRNNTPALEQGKAKCWHNTGGLIISYHIL